MPLPSDDPFASAVSHLEYLGYEVHPQQDGWTFAQHPYRYDFCLRMFPVGIRLHCRVGIGASNGNSRAAWLDFLNAANDRSFLARFALDGNDAGEHWVTMRAMLPAAYIKTEFAILMDMWQEDLDIVRRKPDFPAETEEHDDAESAAPTVN